MEEDILVTIDVNSLYTNIIQKDGESSAEWVLQRQTGLHQEQVKYILEWLKLAMSHIYFWHKGKYYTQNERGGDGSEICSQRSKFVLKQVRRGTNIQCKKIKSKIIS